MKILTAAQMREVDRLTIERGVPAIVLMENAGHRVTEFLVEKFSPLLEHRIVVLCGKGNNGGDGLVVARQLYTRFAPRSLDVVLLAEDPEHLGMLTATGCQVSREITCAMRSATI
ncbi:MAG: NAD(P)H-hydrate epimerase, partial [Bryobacteraceae bacterium]